MQRNAAVGPRRLGVLVPLDRHLQAIDLRPALAEYFQRVPRRARTGSGKQQLCGREAGRWTVLAGLGRGVYGDCLAGVPAERDESAARSIPGDGNRSQGLLLADDRPDEAHEQEDTGEQSQECGCSRLLRPEPQAGQEPHAGNPGQDEYQE